MNGIHDMGGMHGLGPIRVEKNEPVFHARWEGRVIAMRRAVAAGGKITLGLREAIESIPAADYLRMSYYERWFTALIEQLVASGLATRAEIESGKPAKGSVKAVAALKPADAATLSLRVSGAMLKEAVTPRFRAGERVRARNINRVGHTRLPRYARGRAGVIERDRGVQAFPDTHLTAPVQHAQHVYSVRFTARELWGEEASPNDAVYLDLWDDYLEPA
ncbi:MAG TPA: nitrile hydratase subunit beta [Bryobacteraceae bacterium]|jgi:nitrile hydratase|nr:nitrile hydratase subunit beta [Bryobacteraceae bacterium]